MVGRRIARARRRLGLKQPELAEAIGGTPRTISRYETGRTLPRLAVLLRIAAALGTSLDFLTGLAEDPLRPGDPAARRDPSGAAR